MVKFVELLGEGGGYVVPFLGGGGVNRSIHFYRGGGGGQ